MTAHEAIQTVADECGLKYGDIARLLRAILFANRIGAPIDRCVEVLGAEETIRRIREFQRTM